MTSATGISSIHRYAVAFALLIILCTVSICHGSAVAEILTAEERAWLTKNQSRIVLAIETGYAPFVFIDSKDQPDGLAHDYMQLLESKLGVHFKQRRYESLDDILEKVRSGEVHVVNAVTNTPSRSRFISFTEPFITVPNVIVVRKERSGLIREGDMTGLRVSLVKSYAITEQLTKKGLGFEADLVSDDLAGLLNVSFGRSDAAVIDLATASYLIDQKGITNLRVAGKTDSDIKLSMGASQAEPIMHSILQKGLRAITETERQEIHKRWINTFSRSIFAEKRFLFAVAGLLFVILSVIVIILLWNRSLRRQVALRTEALANEKGILRKSEAKQRAIIENIIDVIAIIDPKGIYKYNSSNIDKWFGWQLEEIIGEVVWKNIHPDDLESTRNVFDTLLAEANSAIKAECRYRCKDDSYRWIGYTAVNLLHDPDISGVLFSYHDITDRKLSELDLLDKNRELERFTYTVSHDLKSPLITIQSYAGMIEQDIEAGNQVRAQDDLKRIMNAASKMNNLLDDLLRLSRIGRVINTSVQVDMNRLVKDVLSQMAGSIELQQVEVIVQDELPAVRGDQRRIEEVLQNLVENAIKYRRDQARPSIEIGMREEHGENVFFVQDNGIGIDERYHETIFGLFNKLEARSEGTGIGLALVKRIVEVHGGRVWVESEGAGKGSRFCFTLGQ